MTLRRTAIGVAVILALGLIAFASVVFAKITNPTTADAISGTVGVGNGGTGASSFGQGWIYSNGGTNSLAASTSPTVNYLVATSSTKSTLPYASSTAISVSGASYFGDDLFTTMSGTQLNMQSGSALIQSTNGDMNFFTAFGAKKATFMNSSSVSTVRINFDDGGISAGTAFAQANGPAGGIAVQGSAGIGTSTPWGLLSVSARVSGGQSPLLVVASSTPTATTTAFRIDAAGHFFASSTNPVISSCGTGPTMTGSDKHGTVTTGTTASGCTITFQVAYPVAPTCTVSSQLATSSFAYSVSASAIVTTQQVASNNKFDFICYGN